MMQNRNLKKTMPTPRLPPTGQLLLEGGDGRIALDPETGLNKYGCGPLPNPRLLAFGSSTASTISGRAFAAADHLRDRLSDELSSSSCGEVYQRGLDRVRRELLALCGIDKLPGIEVVIAASGTDLHALVAQYARRYGAARTGIIMMDPDETGCGIHAALGNRYPCPAPSVRYADDSQALVSVRLRRTDGNPRPQDEVDGEVEALANNAIRRGRRVLLIQLDVSKTGLLAPSMACIDRLQLQFADKLDVFVDACQFRIAPASLLAYLQRGCMVAVTGSKFLTGPSFSAALLVPKEVAGRLRSAVMSSSFPLAEWPLSWRVDGKPNHAPNFGLLLRWEAALEEFRNFSTVSEQALVHFLQTFSHAIQRRLENDPMLESLPVLPVERFSSTAEKTWDGFPTIFPFLVFHAPYKLPLSRDETSWIYRSLPRGSVQGDDALCCHLGQPVVCGFHNKIPVSALRLCLSARLIVEGIHEGGQPAASVIDKSMEALDKVKWLAHRV
ncbi:MAG: hypothetical protein NTX45_27880 [Proteobacteria bacterium]|nr:hypothetical protein [Pseudomonadota bacterium]